MEKCPFCGKEVEELENLKLYLNDEFLEDIKACPHCSEVISSAVTSPDFGEKLVAFVKDLDSTWEKGTSKNSKVGVLVKIIDLVDEKDKSYSGKIGVIQHIDDIGQLHGSWGGLAIIPERDNYLVLK